MRKEFDMLKIVVNEISFLKAVFP